ncbi:MAG: hypothetical protein QM791_07470 [Ferruginibacter sp.]
MHALKIILPAALMVLFWPGIYAQKPFEGKITYKMNPVGDTSKKKTFAVYFGKGKLLFETNPTDSMQAGLKLYDFTEGKAWMLNSFDSTAVYMNLMPSFFSAEAAVADSTEKNINILNYRAEKFTALIPASFSS